MEAVPVLATGEWYDAGPAEERSVPRPVLAGAVSASLFLHGVVFAGLANVTFLSRQQENPPDTSREQSVTIILVKHDSVPGEPEDVADSEQASANSRAAEDATGETLPQEAPAPRTRTLLAIPPAAEEITADAESVPGPAPDRAETLAMVSAGIAGYIESQRGETTRTYVEDCIRFRNRYGPTADCPEAYPDAFLGIEPERQFVKEIFATVTREADYARMRDDLARENEFLQEVMETGGPAGEQAEIRWLLNRQYHAYVGGNMLPELTFRAQTAFGNDYGRTITPAPYQFSCGFMSACVYKYTGFGVKRPANYVERTPSFVERPPLFLPSEN